MDTNTGLRQILADLSASQLTLRRSSTAFDAAVAGMNALNDGLADAVAGMRRGLAGIADANHAQGEAIDVVIAATAKALHLFTPTEQH